MPPDGLQILCETPMQLGECPLWHPDEAALYWIDIASHTVHCHRIAAGTHQSWIVPSEPGCIARREGGGLIVAMRTGIAMLDTATGAVTGLLDAPYDTGKMRFNDGRCDAAGRLWLGTLYEPRDQPLGSLFCLERGVLRNIGNPVTVSNGVAFSSDQCTLYHSDTTAHAIKAYEFDVASGKVGNSRLLKQFSSDKSAADYGGRPDGAAVDCEDAYWCAMFEGGRILRISPSGEILQEIRLPVRCPTMVAFGGPDLRTLYITSARHHRPDAELGSFPLSGCVLSMQVDVPGRPESAYIP